MFTSLFPRDESWDAADSHDEWCDDVGAAPRLGRPSSKSEWDENQSEDGNEEDKADDIELPEKLDGETSSTEHVVRRFVFLEGAVLPCTSRDVAQGNDQWQRADGINDGPHANSPLPCRGSQNRGCDVA